MTRKGGVGKSFFLTTLMDWYAQRGVGFTAFDPDWCNGSLTRFFPEAKYLDVAAGNPLDDFHAALAEGDLCLVDGLGPLQSYVFEWLQECQFFREMGDPVEVTYVLMVEEDKDSVFQAGEAARALGDSGQWLVVRNLKTCPTTEIYNTSEARQQLLRLGAVEVQMDRVPWNLLLLLQRTGKTIGALAEDASVPFMGRQRMKSYLSKFFEQMSLAQSLLLPGQLLSRQEPVPSVVSAPPVAGAAPPSRPRVAPERV
ncbi:MAG: hypothetical protein Fur0032_21760 [Terrimicrobiaceae bacterium]